MSLSSDLSSARSIFMAWFSYSTLRVLGAKLPDLDRPLATLCTLCGPQLPACAGVSEAHCSPFGGYFAPFINTLQSREAVKRKSILAGVPCV